MYASIAANAMLHKLLSVSLFLSQNYMFKYFGGSVPCFLEPLIFSFALYLQRFVNVGTTTIHYINSSGIQHTEKHVEKYNTPQNYFSTGLEAWRFYCENMTGWFGRKYFV